ncbi:phosphonate C-P lyase system protein PhnG [Ammonicoccus fulvus]|uniref:Phosphonate C-P lyase system protein PhnG n=1 Tax=Ammonicoccus fulvus TaxID=3138240 RepID=A0ABZ3FJU6_9ACTN
MTTREEFSELLSHADPTRLIDIADRCLADADSAEFTIVRGPEVGTVATQVREPVAGTRFLLTDVLVSSAEISLAGTAGWGMRLGDDRAAVLAQAVCEAELARSGAYAAELRDLCTEVATRQRVDRVTEWERLGPTVVEFEEIP